MSVLRSWRERLHIHDRLCGFAAGGTENIGRSGFKLPHPAHVTPSWYGDSVGHYEGDTLVIDTIGVKTDRPLAMLDFYGTPYTQALHIVERYRLLDYEAAKEGLERDTKERNPIPNTSMQRDPDYRGKYLQLLFTVDDSIKTGRNYPRGRPTKEQSAHN
jgi:hypothetical protein